ncbi:MAG TPA: hypothetical protein EYH26_00420 [Pyrodictium sp.]|nr:hypothetical protein [Pyrodictium sp.]HIQ10429.1 hypothetical protein [Pyrodictium sp.]
MRAPPPHFYNGLTCQKHHSNLQAIHMRTKRKFKASGYVVCWCVKLVEVWVELEPTTRKEKLEKKLEKIKTYKVDALDIPDAPLGVPKAFAPLMACYIQAVYGVKVIPHIRLLDINTNALLNIVGGLLFCGVDNFVILQGDQPKYGNPISELNTDDALQVIRSKYGDRVSVGCLVSLRKNVSEIVKRIVKDYDFFLLMRAVNENLEKIKVLRQIRADAKLIAYVIVCESENCKRLRSMLEGQPIVNVERVDEHLNNLVEYVDGILLSSPGSIDTIVKVLELLNEIGIL